MSAGRWLRLALLLSLVPLALRAASLLLGVPALASRQSWTTDPHERAAAAAVSVWPARDFDRDRDRPYRHARHRRRRAGSGSAASSSDDGARRRLRQAAAGDWFEDDKRLAPTGSNPLHNLR